MSLPDWKANLERARETKETFFAQNWQSSIPPQERPGSKAYTCPFVPVENWLEVPIYAGGKDYHLPETG